MMLAKIRNNKKALFSVMGLVGGALGAALASAFSDWGEGSPVLLVAATALWVGTFSAILTMALYWAQDIYNRRPGFPTEKLKSGLGYGFVAGLIAGGAAQSVYSIPFESAALQNLVFKPACWGLMGAMLGWRLTTVMPNFSVQRAIIAGAIGGTLGGIFFVLSAMAIDGLSELPAQMIGVGLLGAVLGFSLVTVESMFRDASLEITWAPKEITVVALGAKAVSIGGGDDHIYVAGLPQNASGVVIEQGKIYYADNVGGRRTELRNGSKINIGTISVVVKAKQ